VRGWLLFEKEKKITEGKDMRSYSETLSLVTRFAKGLKQRFGEHLAKVLLNEKR